MKLKKTLQLIFEKITGTRIFRNLPYGVDITYDISRRFPNYQFNIIFDVGAHIGQSALNYASTYPSAKIYCFEPITLTYEQLLHNVKSQSRVSCFKLALGNQTDEGTMISEGTSSMNYLIDAKNSNDINTQKTESVNTSTLNDFCRDHNINKIDYLKIDTEGGDLDVLKGAKNILSENSVDFVEVEAGMNPNNKHHASVESLKGFLESQGYFIFAMYDQICEWPKKEFHLRRSNIVFISKKMIRENNYR